MPRRRSRFIWLSGILVAAGFFWAHIGATHVKAQSGQAFSISPPLIELRANPGQTVTATIKFTNVSGGELLIKSQFNDFGAKDETGEPNIIFEDVQNASYSLKNWIASPAPFKIASKETKTLNFPIAVPADAEPGGHYAVIRFTGTSPNLEESGVSLTGSIGSLVLLHVAGEVEEEASLVEFSPARIGHKQNGDPEYTTANFFENGPVGFVARIRNSGNVHLKPTGTIEVYNIFGAKVDTIRVNGNPTESKNQPRSVLPQSIRKFDQKMADQFMFGKYTAKLHLSYGEGQKPIETTIDFWVIPYKLIILILVGLTGLFFGLRWGIRRYNRYIIDKARGNSGGLRLRK